MFFSQPALQSDNAAPIALSADAALNPDINMGSKHSDPVLVSSIAESAGLSRFVYLVGKSRQRHVFSAINKGQMSLYCDAVFAIVEENDERLWVGDYTQLIRILNHSAPMKKPRIFVHLLAEGEIARSHVISDLTRTACN